MTTVQQAATAFRDHLQANYPDGECRDREWLDAMPECLLYAHKAEPSESRAIEVELLYLRDDESPINGENIYASRSRMIYSRLTREWSATRSSALSRERANSLLMVFSNSRRRGVHLYGPSALAGGFQRYQQSILGAMQSRGMGSDYEPIPSVDLPSWVDRDAMDAAVQYMNREISAEDWHRALQRSPELADLSNELAEPEPPAYAYESGSIHAIRAFVDRLNAADGDTTRVISEALRGISPREELRADSFCGVALPEGFSGALLMRNDTDYDGSGIQTCRAELRLFSNGNHANATAIIIARFRSPVSASFTLDTVRRDQQVQASDFVQSWNSGTSGNAASSMAAREQSSVAQRIREDVIEALNSLDAYEPTLSHLVAMLNRGARDPRLLDGRCFRNHTPGREYSAPELRRFVVRLSDFDRRLIVQCEIVARGVPSPVTMMFRCPSYPTPGGFELVPDGYQDVGEDQSQLSIRRIKESAIRALNSPGYSFSALMDLRRLLYGCLSNDSRRDTNFMISSAIGYLSNFSARNATRSDAESLFHVQCDLNSYHHSEPIPMTFTCPCEPRPGGFELIEYSEWPDWRIPTRVVQANSQWVQSPFRVINRPKPPFDKKSAEYVVDCFLRKLNSRDRMDRRVIAAVNSGELTTTSGGGLWESRVVIDHVSAKSNLRKKIQFMNVVFLECDNPGKYRLAISHTHSKESPYHFELESFECLVPKEYTPVVLPEVYQHSIVDYLMLGGGE